MLIMAGVGCIAFSSKPILYVMVIQWKVLGCLPTVLIQERWMQGGQLHHILGVVEQVLICCTRPTIWCKRRGKKK